MDGPAFQSKLERQLAADGPAAVPVVGAAENQLPS